MAWFSKYAKLAIGIDISEKVLSEAKNFILKNGNIKNVKLYLSNDYEKNLPQLDYVYCRFVFQHISKDQCKKYLEVIDKQLKIEGKINLQFRLGTQEKIEPYKEPIIEYTLEEIDKLLLNYELTNFKIDKNHVYITGIKLI